MKSLVPLIKCLPINGKEYEMYKAENLTIANRLKKINLALHENAAKTLKWQMIEIYWNKNEQA